MAELTSMVFSFVPFNCRVNKGYILCKKSTVLLLFYTAVYDSDTQIDVPFNCRVNKKKSTYCSIIDTEMNIP